MRQQRADTQQDNCLARLHDRPDDVVEKSGGRTFDNDVGSPAQLGHGKNRCAAAERIDGGAALPPVPRRDGGQRRSGNGTLHDGPGGCRANGTHAGDGDAHVVTYILLPRISRAFATTSGGALYKPSTSFCISAASSPSTSTRSFRASANRSGSFRAALKADLMAARRSGGMPGAMMNGRPNFSGA